MVTRIKMINTLAPAYRGYCREPLWEGATRDEKHAWEEGYMASQSTAHVTLEIPNGSPPVRCAPPHNIQDDVVFIYRNDSGNAVVYGVADARKYQDELILNGYKHTATISASIILERAINMESIHDVWDAIHFIDT